MRENKLQLSIWIWVISLNISLSRSIDLTVNLLILFSLLLKHMQAAKEAIKQFYPASVSMKHELESQEVCCQIVSPRNDWVNMTRAIQYQWTY